MVLKRSDRQKQCFQERRCVRTLVLEGFHLQESYHFRLPAWAPRAAAQTQEIYTFRSTNTTLLKPRVPGQAEILRNTTLSRQLT